MTQRNLLAPAKPVPKNSAVIIIPEHDKPGEIYPGNIKPGYYRHYELIALLRKHAGNKSAVIFLADMME